MGTRVITYKKSGGMVAKTATEDFHFLNKLRKYGTIEFWNDTAVYPSPRMSRRVTLGTGYFLASYELDPQKTFSQLMLPSPNVFEEFHVFLHCIKNYFQNKSLIIGYLNKNKTIISSVNQHNLKVKLEELAKNTRSKEMYLKRLPQIFDGLQTWRFLRIMRNQEPYPTEKIFLRWCQEIAGIESKTPIQILEKLRFSERTVEQQQSIRDDLPESILPENLNKRVRVGPFLV